MRLLGEMLKRAEKASGGEHGGRARIDGPRREPSNPTPTLADLGITKKESALAQKVADLPRGDFEAEAEAVFPFVPVTLT
jgi:hypothetical protein